MDNEKALGLDGFMLAFCQDCKEDLLKDFVSFMIVLSSIRA